MLMGFCHQLPRTVCSIGPALRGTDVPIFCNSTLIWQKTHIHIPVMSDDSTLKLTYTRT